KGSTPSAGVWTLLFSAGYVVLREKFAADPASIFLLSRKLCASPRSTLMMSSQSHAESLRKAIENLINVKLHDALSKPGGLDRLVAHRSSGVASFAVRQAERQLEESIALVLDPVASGSYADA